MPRWETDLHTAARSGKLDLVKALTTPENINSKSSWGYTPFNCACYGGHLEVMRFLIAAGADIKLCNGSRWTPLHAACLRGKKDAVKFLLENGARECVRVFSNTSPPPLNVAASSWLVRDGDILKLLLDAGADVNFPNNHGSPPLIEAVRTGSESKVKVLLEAGANVDATDSNGSSPLHLAVHVHFKPEIIRLLIEAGADVNRKNNRGEVPLETAIRSSSCSAEVLLDYGAGDTLCWRHDCDSSMAMCLYRTWRTIARTDCFERYFIKMQAAGLYAGKGNTLLDPLVNGIDWNLEKKTAFRKKCETELSTMKAEKVSGTNVTYLDVLYQRPCALRIVEALPFEETRAKLPIYGALVRIRLMAGRRKLPLLEQSSSFFYLPSDPLPYLPPECVSHILGYLSLQDLKTVASICKPHWKRQSTQPSSSLKRPSDAVEPASKPPKVLCTSLLPI